MLIVLMFRAVYLHFERVVLREVQYVMKAWGACLRVLRPENGDISGFVNGIHRVWRS